MSNSIAPGSSADVNVKVRALTDNPNVPVTYKTIILKKNLVNGVNTLTQEMMSAQNTKYVIKYDYVLGGDITVPENCILEFDGGSISASGNNDTITGQNTAIKAGFLKIFSTDISIVGNWNVIEAYPEWFGAVGSNADKDDAAIQALLNNSPFNVRLLEKIYYIKQSILVDVQKRYFKGLSGRSVIYVTQELNEDSAVVFYSDGVDGWNRRGYQVQQHGYFQLKCNNYCGGIRLGGKHGTSLEGGVDENNIRCVQIWDANWGMIIGSHVFKCIIDDIVNARNTLTLTIDDNATDNGECLTFNNCFFADSGKTIIGCPVIFNNCSFHTPIEIKNNDTHVAMFGCHIEYIHGGGTEEEPMEFLICLQNRGLLEMTNCEGTAGDTIYANNVFKTNDTRAEIHVNGGGWEGLFKKIKVSDGYYFCEGNIFINDVRMDYLFAGFIPYKMFSAKNYVPKVESIEELFGFKVSGNNASVEGVDIENIANNGGIRVFTPQQYVNGLITLSQKYRIPNYKRTVIFTFIVNSFTKLNWVKMGDHTICFYDKYGNLISNEGYSGDISEAPVKLGWFTSIPLRAEYVEISIFMMAFSGNGSSAELTNWAVDFI